MSLVSYQQHTCNYIAIVTGACVASYCICDWICVGKHAHVQLHTSDFVHLEIHINRERKLLLYSYIPRVHNTLILAM